jgi:hypothetical protein
VLAGGEELTAATPAVELLSFGSLAENDQVELNLQQVRWTGGIGLFFAHQASAQAGVEGGAFQAVVIVPADAATWKILWWHYDYPEEDRRFWRGKILDSLPLGELANRPVKVKLKLVAGQIAELTIDERHFPVPLIDSVDEPARRASSGPGEFGMLLNHSGGSASALRINGSRLRFELEPHTPNHKPAP